jgi:glycosyltransferase involved in cell wall biosynthesis
MRILYSAIDQTVPGTKGGSVHVAAVAEGLAALGHEVTALVTPGGRRQAETQVRTATGGIVRWVSLPAPLGRPHLRLLRAPAIARIVGDVRPDVIVERYHNFGGEAIRAARGAGALAVLEVNTPAIDHPGSMKAIVDHALLIQPMRRWREALCARADLIVSPSAAIVPPSVPRDRILQLEWGADTDRFRPDVTKTTAFARPAGVSMVAVFAGAFRSWHGAIHLVRAIRRLHEHGRRDVGAVLIGDGPEWRRVHADAGDTPGIVFTGALPHDAMPAALAVADVGVAPFDLHAHAPLSLGFYWSPLKMFEYMAAGLPVVAPAADRIPSLVAHGREGILYDAASDGGLADALVELTDGARRERLGAAARERAVRDYSWAAHCRALDAAFRQARGDGNRCGS